MPMIALAAPGPIEPVRCVTPGWVPARSILLPTVIIVLVPVWVALVVAVGVPPRAATAGLGTAVGLVLRVAARLAARRRDALRV